MAKQSFEQYIARLEEITRLLETGDIPLDDSIKLYEEGKELTEKCSEILKNAEQKITVMDGNKDDI